MIDLRLGDCRAVLAEMPECSVDAVVCDPPYDLTQIGRSLQLSKNGDGTDRTKQQNYINRGFMGMRWDGQGVAFQPATWEAVLRVMKPGAFLLAFGGDRTIHRMITAIEDAGFEIRGQLAWIHSQGFPKNHNVSKALREILPPDVLCVCARHSSQTTEGFQSGYRGCHGFDDEQPQPGQDDDQDASPSQDDVHERSRDGLRMDAQERAQANTSLDGDSAHPSNDCWPHQIGLELEAFQENGSTQSDMASSTLRGVSTVEHRTVSRRSDTLRSASGSAASSSDSPDRGYSHLPHCTTCGKVVVQDGFGTSLKPAMELIVLARKPLEGTCAANVARWGVGALNIAASRVGSDVITTHSRGANTAFPKRPGETTVEESGRISRQDGIDTSERLGRWPSNVILSHAPECRQVGTKRVKSGNSNAEWSVESTVRGGLGGKVGRHYADADGLETVESWICADQCPVAELDRQAGPSVARPVHPDNLKRSGDGESKGLFGLGSKVQTGYYDTSTNVSRFFYVAKASRADRELGLEHFEVATVNDGRDTPIDNPYQRGETERKNTHPTVKPTELMKYLVRLITPPSGVVLDPFCGSGSTGVAAMLEGFDFIGIEMEAEYLAIAQARIEAAAAIPRQHMLFEVEP